MSTTPIVPEERPSPRWGWLAVLCPVVAVVFGIVFGLSSRSQAGLLGVIYLFATLAAVGGTLCSVISLSRKERYPVIAVLGLLLSLGPFLLLASAVVIHRANQ